MATDPDYARDRCIAALAILQPGIEPVFLVVLTSATGLPPAHYGWVVGAGQLGMAAGSILCWGGGRVATRPVALIAAAIAIAASLLMTDMSDLGALAALRAIFGLCLGLIFTRSSGIAARIRPDHAFGTIFLIQLLLSTAVTALLPLMAEATDSASAIRLLALCPAAILLLLLSTSAAPDATTPAPITSVDGLIMPPAAFAAALALFLFVCVSMLIWSYVGAIGGAMKLSDRDIGLAVAIGSLSGVFPAILGAFSARRCPAAAIGLICGVAMMTPLLAFAADLGRGGFIAAMCLFNIGFTFALIRLSGLAIPANAGARSRRAVAALQCLGMAAGPLVAAVAVGSGGFLVLGIVAAGTLAIAVAGLVAQALVTALLAPAVRDSSPRPARRAIKDSASQ